jgi:hypothetical protein
MSHLCIRYCTTVLIKPAAAKSKPQFLPDSLFLTSSFFAMVSAMVLDGFRLQQGHLDSSQPQGSLETLAKHEVQKPGVKMPPTLET